MCARHRSPAGRDLVVVADADLAAFIFSPWASSTKYIVPFDRSGLWCGVPVHQDLVVPEAKLAVPVFPCSIFDLFAGLAAVQVAMVGCGEIRSLTPEGPM